MKWISLIVALGALVLASASPLVPGDVVINGDCKHCNVHGG